ncbi:hypothetical protein RchiOBHm_Chr6g0271531 [Rosa chinensis]|uniref:Uncharacterized protein n=1 Tax=Rosa chinensis TaxID=74649 RepID=A0A2P6PR25_ROSCH|nr:hypothetical protein RchiOBHm_Chr6g0271531 [Rosa chinensis]
MEIELETETGRQSSKRRRSCVIDGLNSMSRFCTGFSAFEIGFPATGSERFFEQLARTSITCLYNQSLRKISSFAQHLKAKQLFN